MIRNHAIRASVVVLAAAGSILSFGAAQAQFVCPVLGGQAGEHGAREFVQIAGGDFTVIGPDVNVPVHATNGDGAGSPGGDHASPGDPGYSPIWN